MPYAIRNPQGLIVSLHRDAIDGSVELDSDHPDVLAFVGMGEPVSTDQASVDQSKFSELDANLVRVLEDLIDLLIARNVIRVTDLPLEAQHKLFNRKHFRDRANKHALRLFEDAGDSFDTSL